jgi:hypothetical protein
MPGVEIAKEDLAVVCLNPQGQVFMTGETADKIIKIPEFVSMI